MEILNLYKNKIQDTVERDRYRCVLKTQSFLIIIVDAGTQIKEANDALLLKCGMSKEQLLGRFVTSIVFQDDRSVFEEYFKHLYQCSDPLELEFRLISSKGARWTSWEFISLKDDTGSIIEIVGLGRDISTPKLNEELLHRAEERYRAMLGNNPVIVYTIALGSPPKIVYVSPKIEKLLGYSQEEWLEETRFWNKCSHPEDINNILNKLEEVIQSGESFIQEYRMIHQKGNIVWVRDEAHIVRDIMGNPIGIQGFILNITEWKRTEEALRQSELNNRSLLDVIPDEMYLINVYGDIVSILERQTSGKGIFTASNVSGNLIDLYPQTAPRFMDYVKKTLQTHKLQIFDFQIIKEQEVNNYEARLVVFDKDEVMAIIRDINERVQLEQMKTDFIHRAAHELRTPLTTAIMMADLIHEGGGREELEEYWEILQRELSRQRNLVEELLTMGRIEKDALQITLTPIEVKPILEEVVNTIRHISGKKGISIRVLYSPEVPTIIGDAHALQQIFGNLIDNAVKYTQGEGEIIISVKPEAGGVNVVIEDSGIGIPEQDLPHIFKRFYRASNAEKSEIQGSGVGLYISKSIIDSLQGRLMVQNKPVKGTIFTVWFPPFLPK